jgi:RNA polymerase sigma-70 factor, ECF subfamily
MLAAAMSDDAIDAAIASWPGLRIQAEAVAAYAESCGECPTSAGAWAEVALAAACRAHDKLALALLDAHYLDAVPTALAHMRLPVDQVDAVRQLVRDKLLVSEAGVAPKLDSYVGQGRLRGLVKVMAVRFAIGEIRKANVRRNAGDEPLAQLAAEDDDPELAFIKERYRPAFHEAFEAAVRELSSRERNLLRLQLDAGLTVEQLGQMYGVHRGTVTRWLTQLRQSLLRNTRERLADHIGAKPNELETLIELLQSRLDQSVRRMLHTVDESPHT